MNLRRKHWIIELHANNQEINTILNTIRNLNITRTTTTEHWLHTRQTRNRFLRRKP